MFAIGVGLTSACNLRCPHCYAGGGSRVVDLPLDSLERALDRLRPDTVNIGTGEAALHPGFHAAVEEITRRGIALSLTTNGTSLASLTDEQLVSIHDIDVSIDFPTRVEHDGWRGPGAFDTATEAILRCRALGVPCSIVCCLMGSNAACAGGLCEMASGLGVDLRVNVYKPVRSRSFSPDYQSFWRAVADFGTECALASCGEPIVNAALLANGYETGVPPSQPCGTSGIRIAPSGEINGCVYVPGSGRFVDDPGLSPSSLGDIRGSVRCTPVPPECGGCAYVGFCRGGCFGRRYYTGLDSRDEFCFVGRSVPSLPAPSYRESGRWVHSGYLCTLIYTPR